MENNNQNSFHIMMPYVTQQHSLSLPLHLHINNNNPISIDDDDDDAMNFKMNIQKQHTSSTVNHSTISAE